MGPTVIFDKSALQSLNMEEAVLFDALFTANIVPLFYVETLADLEKEVDRGKDPEALVGMLAAKTPVMKSYPNFFHRDLLLSELFGDEIPMTGQVLIAEGQRKQSPDGKVGLHVEEFPEARAFQRWQVGKFLEVERDGARQWRAQLAEQDPSRVIARVQHVAPADKKFADLGELKAFADAFCSSADQEVLQLALEVLDVPEGHRQEAKRRWEALDRPPLDKFAPYTTHVFKVDLVYYLGIWIGLIGGRRATNRVDMAYLYYLPFANAFTSNDNLHHRTAPLFLSKGQSYVPLKELKPALAEIEEQFSALPEAIQALGVFHFASYPPLEAESAVTRLWDTHRPGWRERAKASEGDLGKLPDKEAGRQTIGEIQGRMKAAQAIPDEAVLLGDQEHDYTVIQRRVPATKGKWRMVSKEIEEAGGGT